MPDKVRLNALDGLRGLAAISVIFWHWQHMFFEPSSRTFVLQRTSQPFYGLFHGFFNYAYRAVDLFFVISGFVFFWLYAEAIARRRVSPLTFASRRISRLFPLHLLTFGLVVGLQAIYSQGAHTTFVYSQPDRWHTLLHLIGVSFWLPNAQQTFNGPFWSVSIELLLYLIFFLFCRFATSLRWPTVIMVLLGLSLRHGHPELMRGMVGFFLGGLAYFSFSWSSSQARSQGWLMGFGALTVLGWVAMANRNSLLRNEAQCDLVFAITLVFITLLERRFPAQLGKASHLGNISFSVYLLHFPLQLVFVLVNKSFGGKPEIFYQPWMFLLFLGTLLPLGFLSYHAYERPAQTFLRGLRLRRSPIGLNSGAILRDIASRRTTARRGNGESELPGV